MASFLRALHYHTHNSTISDISTYHLSISNIDPVCNTDTCVLAPETSSCEYNACIGVHAPRGADMCSITHAIGNPFDESLAANKRGTVFRSRIHKDDDTFFLLRIPIYIYIYQFLFVVTYPRIGVATTSHRATWRKIYRSTKIESVTHAVLIDAGWITHARWCVTFSSRMTNICIIGNLPKIFNRPRRPVTPKKTRCIL